MQSNRTGDRLGASSAPLGEELAEALGAVGLVVARCESLSRQGVVAVAAGEAVSVPRLVLVRHAAAGDDLRQRERARCIPQRRVPRVHRHALLSRALVTKLVTSFRDPNESLSGRGLITTADARAAPKAKGAAYLVALDTPGGELILVASGTVDLLLARDEALRADRVLADHAAEALLVPLSGLVLHLLGT